MLQGVRALNTGGRGVAAGGKSRWGGRLERPSVFRPSPLPKQTSSTRTRAAMDVEGIRRDTPGCKGKVHFNNAGSALPTKAVLDASKGWLDLEAEIGGYEAVSERAEALGKPYTAIAQLLNCSPDEVAVVSSATVAWQQVFFGIPFREGDRILTSQAEYGSNFINFLQVSQRYGAQVEVIPETEEGDIDLEALRGLVDSSPPPRIIAITHVPTSSGRVYDAEAVGGIARSAGVPFLLDACQSVGQMPIDVQRIACDFLSATGRKYLRAPRGCGFLYARRSAMEKHPPALLDVWGAEWESPTSFSMAPTARRYESYEMSFAAKVGLGVAVEYALALSLQSIWQRVQLLASSLRKGLSALPGVHVADKGRVLCGIVSFTKSELLSLPIIPYNYHKEGVSPDSIKQRLSEDSGINVSVSLRRSTVLDFDERGLEAVVRASVHYYNTEEEVEMLVAAVETL